MPLKHALETRLVILLGAAMMLTGFLVALLPPLPQGAVAWSGLFLATAAYPVALFPLFRRDRADKAFRLLHWVPFVITTAWLPVGILKLLRPEMAAVAALYMWAWCLPAVFVGIVLLAWFCLHVIRRRERRVPVLAALFAVFAALGLTNQMHSGWERTVASILRGDETGSGRFVGSNDGEGVQNLNPSSDPHEEEWRASLRAVNDRRRQAVERLKGGRGSSASGASSALDGIASSALASSASRAALPQSLRPGGTGAHLRELADKPVALPQSGFGFDVLLLGMGSAYCAVLHDRARRRARA